VSGTKVTPEAGGPQRDSAGPPGVVAARRWLTPVNMAIAVFTVLGLVLRLYLLGRPGYLLGVTQYDDGPYFGSALRLVHGAVPYRNFIIVQPPGITLLMTPAALLAQVTGTAWGMAVGRILTIVASSAGILMVGLLARHRGLLAVTLACGILAIFPGSLVAAHTVLLEPWLVLFCLAGALAVLDRDRMASSGRRLLFGGLAFGFAGAVEVWAVIPVVVVAILLARQVRRAALFVVGVAVGFGVPVLPFAALSPRRFYNSFFAAQLFRVVPSPTPVEKRLRMMTGIGQVLHLGDTGVLIATLVIVIFVPAALVAAWLISRQPPAALDWFAVGTTALVVAAFLWYAQFFLHFPAFLAPFLGLSIGLAAGRLAAALQRGERQPGETRPRPGTRVQWMIAALATAGVVVLAVIQGQHDQNVTPRVSPAALAIVQRLVHPGACVLTDQVSFTIAAGRFYSNVPGCSLMVDSIGTDYALGHGRDASSGAADYPGVKAVWRNAFTHAQYVWLNERFNRRRVAWTPGLRYYFYGHFRKVYTDGQNDILYARRMRG
jgi:Glycosyltransferase family 87